MSADDEMRRIAERFETISDKIRALSAAGYSKSETARFLQRRYQQVRNVLKQDEIRGRPALAPSPPGVRETGAVYVHRVGSSDTKSVCRLNIGPSGEVTLPPAVLEAMRWRPGGVIIADIEEDRVTLLSTAASVKQLQAMVRELLPNAGNLVDEFIAERRLEAASEDNDG